MPFNPGDRVRYLNEKGEGIVTRILDDDRVEIEDEHGFLFIKMKSEIVGEGKSVVSEKEIKERLRSISINTRRASAENQTASNYRQIVTDRFLLSRNYWTPKDKDFVEIDLHIEEIVEKPAGLSDGLKLETQLNHARLCLEEALELKIKRIIFIHGVGSGVLRHELRNWLKTLSYLEMNNADHRRYGIGATEVRFRSFH